MYVDGENAAVMEVQERSKNVVKLILLVLLAMISVGCGSEYEVISVGCGSENEVISALQYSSNGGK